MFCSSGYINTAVHNFILSEKCIIYFRRKYTNNFPNFLTFSWTFSCSTDSLKLFTCPLSLLLAFRTVSELSAESFLSKILSVCSYDEGFTSLLQGKQDVLRISGFKGDHRITVFRCFVAVGGHSWNKDLSEMFSEVTAAPL